MRKKNDNYPTPAKTIEALLPHLDLTNINRFLEPCRGNGVIYDRIPARHKAYREIREGKDYFTSHYRKPFDLIITNPPFGLWRKFLEKSLKEVGEHGCVIYLLRLNVLGSGKKTQRAEFWNTHRPSHLFPLEERPSFNGKGTTDMTDYCWVAWDDYQTVVKADHWLNVL